MIKRISFPIMAVAILNACGLFRGSLGPTTPSPAKIQVITHLHGNALKKAFILQLLQTGFDIDATLGPDPMTILPRVYENYDVELFVSFQDSIATVYGNFGYAGLNSLGQKPAANNIVWTPIVVNGNGWEIMKIAAALPAAQNQK